MSDSPTSILVICTRRLGDVLLATPLIRTLRRGYPQARIDALVFPGCRPALAGNPDLDRVLPTPEGAGLRATIETTGIRRRSYDLAVSTLYSDRPHLLALWAARRRVAVVPPHGEPGARWKRWLAERWVERDSRSTHTVVQYLRLADVLGLPRVPELVPPRPADASVVESALPENYVAVHPAPMFRYKAWTVSGWQALIRWIAKQGLRTVVTGAPAESERRYVQSVVDDLNLPDGAVRNLAGTLPFEALTPVLERARAYVGPDTSVTHLAAACGTKTVALFGPSNLVAWGPWPKGFDGDAPSPWRNAAPLQQCGNVWLLQGLGPCVPCHLEGCERRLDSASRCLEELPAARVIAQLARALA